MTESESTAKPSESQEASKAPVFGAAFGTSGGFAGFTGVTPPERKPEDAEAAGGEDEEECKAEFTPLVQLEEVETNTGEENEECLLSLKCKMYRYDKDSSGWKERGIGQAKFLQHKGSKKIRFLMRQEKTLKIRANHIIMPGTKITSHGGNDKAWVWSAMDYADEEQKMEMLAIRFGTAEKAIEFKEQYEKAMDENAQILPPSNGANESAHDPKAVKSEPAAASDNADKQDAEVDKLADKVAETKVD